MVRAAPEGEKPEGSITIVVPSEHPAMCAVREAFLVYERRLRSRAQERATFRRPSRLQLTTAAPVAWNVQERRELARLVERDDHLRASLPGSDRTTLLAAAPEALRNELAELLDGHDDRVTA